MLIVLSSGAFVQLIKDGGARDQGLENALRYSGPLNMLPFIWAASVLFVIGILFFKKKLKRINYSSSLIALIVLCFSSAVWADFPTVSFRVTLLVAIAYLLISTQISLYGWKATVQFLCVTFFLILLFSLLTILIIPSYGVAVGVEHAGKWQGVFDHKNSLGNFASISFLFFVWQNYQRKSKWMLAAALLAIVLAIGSESGTGLANIGIILFIFAMLRFKFTAKKVYRLRYILIAAFVALSIFAVFVAIGFEEFSIFAKDSSFTGRNLIWSYILIKVAASPWIGYGLDQLSALTNKNSAEFFTNVGFLVNTAHNGFLETAFSLGSIGLLLVVLILTGQLTKKNKGIGFSLFFCYVISFILVNTFESKMISFNINFVGLMYVVSLVATMAAQSEKNVSVSAVGNRYGIQVHERFTS